jgi:hypothetical protein
MKATCAILPVLLIAVAVSGCSKKETPAPVVVEQNRKPEPPEPDPKPEKDEIPQAVEPNRVAAEWVLGIGGKVRVVIDSEKREIKALTDLPQAAFVIDVVDTQSKTFNDADLENLNGLNRLKALWIRDAPITGSGLARVHDLAELEVLGLEGTAFADGSLEHLKDMPRLINLHLDRTPVTDAGLAHIVGTKLTILGLGGTKVTDAGLEHLKKVKSLRSISLNNTMVTDAGVADFKTAVPECDVLR